MHFAAATVVAAETIERMASVPFSPSGTNGGGVVGHGATTFMARHNFTLEQEVHPVYPSAVR